MAEALRQFDTGATRDSASGKPDYEGFLSPLVVEAFGVYMDYNRVLPDGSLRDSDNWQLGIPRDQYVKSAFRHFVDLWKWHRGHTIKENIVWACCGVLFNVQGYLHEMLQETNLDEVGLARAEMEKRRAEKQPPTMLDVVQRILDTPRSDCQAEAAKPDEWVPQFAVGDRVSYKDWFTGREVFGVVESYHDWNYVIDRGCHPFVECVHEEELTAERRPDLEIDQSAFDTSSGQFIRLLRRVGEVEWEVTNGLTEFRVRESQIA